METTGPIVAARVVHPDDEITLITTNGQALRLKVKHIRQAGRATMGTRLINLKEGDTVASVARLSAKDLEPAVAEEPKNGQTAPVGQPSWPWPVRTVRTEMTAPSQRNGLMRRTRSKKSTSSTRRMKKKRTWTKPTRPKTRMKARKPN